MMLEKLGTLGAEGREMKVEEGSVGRCVCSRRELVRLSACLLAWLWKRERE